MSRKKKGNAKGHGNKSDENEDAHRELPVGGIPHRQNIENNDRLAYSSSDSGSSNAPEGTGRNGRGKAKADPRLSPIPDNLYHELAIYRPQRQEDNSSMQRDPLQHPSGSELVRNPQQIFREGPSGGFFEGSSNIEVKGGSFNQAYGHHTNVTIHVSQPRDDEHGPSQHSYPPPMALPSATSRNIPPPPPQEVHRSQYPNAVADNEPGLGSYHTTTIIYSPDNSNKIYERHLGLKQRGFPLWIPEPNRRLPMEYRRKGVHVGDVGIITPSGAFSFLFNVCLPPNHPINPTTLPEGFTPIYFSNESLDIREYSEFKPESYLASTAIEKTNNDPPFRGLSFMTSAAEGAVLTLPDGAVALDLENIPQIRAYAAAHIENWYRYINGPRGREAKNGEVRLVIGCDKATSWGMAAVANLSQHKTHYLKYRSVVNTGGSEAQPAPIPLYKWDYTGLAEARVGPDLDEIADLKRDDDSNVVVDGKYWNQCLFMRTLNLTLSEEVFGAINREVEAALVVQMQQFQTKAGPSAATSSHRTVGSQTESTASGQSNSHQDTQSGQASNSLDFASEKSSVESVTTSRSPTAPKSHPADVLNKLLLQKVPNCRVVVTQDEDWCSVLNEDDEIMPTPSEIAERVLATHHIREEDGVVFLEPKNERKSALRRHQTVGHSLQGSVEFERRMAGVTSSALRNSELAWRPPSRTGIQASPNTASASINAAIRLEVLSGSQHITSPLEESLRETGPSLYAPRHNHPDRPVPVQRSTKYRGIIAFLAGISLLVQVMQLAVISPRQMAVWNLEFAITILFDVELGLTIIEHLSNWQSLLHLAEMQVDIISALVSTIIQFPVIRHSRFYSLLSFAELLRMYRVPIGIRPVRQFLISIAGHQYTKLNLSLFAVVGNGAGAVFILRNVFENGSFGPKLHMSHAELFVVASWGLYLTVANIFIFKVFRAIYFGEMSAVDELCVPSHPRLERRKVWCSTYMDRICEQLSSAIGPEAIPMYDFMQFERHGNELGTRYICGSTSRMRIFKPFHAVAVICRRLVKPMNSHRRFGASPSPVLQPLFKAYILLAIYSNILVSFIATPAYRSQFTEPVLKTWFGRMDFAYVIILLAEFLVKVIADGLYAKPNGYIPRGWNWLDLIILSGTEYNFIDSLVSVNSSGMFTRSLRALSVLRLVTTSDTVRKTLSTFVASSAGHISHVIILAILYTLPYIVWNIKVYASAERIENEVDFAMFSLMPCVLMPMALLICVMEHVSIGYFGTLNNKRRRAWKELNVYLTRQTYDQYRAPPKPTNLLGRFFYDRLENHVWFRVVQASLGASLLFELLILALYSNPSSVISIIYLLVTVIPLTDFLGRYYCIIYGPKYFIFNAVIAIGNFASGLEALHLHKDRNIFVLALQSILALGLLFKLLNPLRGFTMFVNVVISLSFEIIGLLGLWLVFLTLNVISALEIFGIPQMYAKEPLNTDVSHILSMFTLWGSGNEWIQYADSCFQAQTVPSFPTRACHSRAWAYTLFASWIFINTYICVQAYNCKFAEKFSHFSQFFGAVPTSISSRDMEDFRALWSRFRDPRTGALARQDFPAFFSQLTGAFEIRCYPAHYSMAELFRPDGHSRTAQMTEEIVRLNNRLLEINNTEIKERKRIYARIYHEAKYKTQLHHSMNFSQMLLLITYHKLAGNNPEYLSAQEMVERRAIDKEVQDLIRLDRVQSLLKMLIWRRRFLVFRQNRMDSMNSKRKNTLLSLLPAPEDTKTSSMSWIYLDPPMNKTRQKDLDLVDIFFPPKGVPTDDLKGIALSKLRTPAHAPRKPNIESQNPPYEIISMNIGASES
ncbi:hypothetical protein BDN70DRAFT_834144 [Pholiota conissans]|uniref:Ion transport domain-containing protein n=1 Tax=Pholiota conissans TaxID=109636 RepID=A0A9P5Z1B4_9AGAR|nr:hypothetical protein BDN70DRAFT_834144 [Pholiota conissans]